MPRIDLDAPEKHRVEGKDGREDVGGRVTHPLSWRGNFGPTAAVLRRPPHTSHELHTATRLDPPPHRHAAAEMGTGSVGSIHRQNVSASTDALSRGARPASVALHDHQP